MNKTTYQARLPYLLLAALCLLSSCIIRVGDNYYRQLTPENKNRLRAYKHGLADSLQYIEVTAEDIKSAMPSAPYTWVHLWKPYCAGPHCYPLFYYDRIAQQHKNVQFFLVSHNYDFKKISERVGGTYNHPIYIIKDSVYGHKALKNRDAIARQLTGTNINGREADAAHLIFKGDKLVYKGYDMSQHIMDSVLKVTIN